MSAKFEMLADSASLRGGKKMELVAVAAQALALECIRAAILQFLKKDELLVPLYWVLRDVTGGRDHSRRSFDFVFSLAAQPKTYRNVYGSMAVMRTSVDWRARDPKADWNSGAGKVVYLGREYWFEFRVINGKLVVTERGKMQEG